MNYLRLANRYTKQFLIFLIYLFVWKPEEIETFLGILHFDKKLDLVEQLPGAGHITWPGKVNMAPPLGPADAFLTFSSLELLLPFVIFVHCALKATDKII